MYVLGIEAATPVAAAAVATEHKVMAERMINNKRTHSVNLLPMIKEVLSDAGVDKQQLAGIAVSIGPGSFTGLRIGLSTARALAQVLNIPLVGVATLEALAYPLRGCSGLICPMLNARKKEVYAAIYRSDKQGFHCLKPSFAVEPSLLMEQLACYGQRVTFIGDGAMAYQDLIRQQLSQNYFPPLCATYPRGAAVAELGMLMLSAGKGQDPLEVLPHYVRPSEAEIKWRERCATTRA